MLLFFVANLGFWLTFWKWKTDRWRGAHSDGQADG
jgi:hypothetical protein